MTSTPTAESPPPPRESPPPPRESHPSPVIAPIEGLLTAKGLASASRVVFILAAALALAYLVRPVILPVLLAWVGATALKTPVMWLRRVGFSPMLSALTVVVLVAVTAGISATHLIAPAVEWMQKAPEELPKLREKFAPILRPAARLSEAATQVGKLSEEHPSVTAPKVEVQDHRMANTVFTWTGGLMAAAAETIALLFLFLASGEVFFQKMVRVMPRLRSKKRLVEISREIHSRISTYLFAVGWINLGFGAAVGTALYLLGLPNPVMWGAVAGLSNFVPYLGPLLSLALFGIAGLVSFDTWEMGLLPAAVFLLLHLLEANAITPLVLGHRFALNPIIIFLALIFLLWLWGVAGAFLAGPLLVSTKVICERIPEFSFVAELLSPNRVGDAAG